MQLLDSNREEPNEDTLECLCKLLGNVGEELDQTDFKVVSAVLMWVKSGKFKFHILIFFSFFEFFIWCIVICFIFKFPSPHLRLMQLHSVSSPNKSMGGGLFLKKVFTGEQTFWDKSRGGGNLHGKTNDHMTRRGEGVSQIHFPVIWTK